MKFCVPIILLAIFIVSCAVPGVNEMKAAKEVVKYFEGTGVISKERNRSITKKVYISPNTNYRPHFTFYEVTSETEVEKIEEAAKKAMSEITIINKITLHFRVKENFYWFGIRGGEKEFKKVVLDRE